MVRATNLLVMIPTFNENENVAKIAQCLLGLNIPMDILFIDDNSPDGTGRILNSIKGMHGHSVIHVIHRKGKEGIGSAHKLGISYAYLNGFKTLITMDADGTHDTKEIPVMLQLIEGVRDYDVIVGSRFICGDSLEGWTVWRKFVTHMGHVLTKTLLNIPQDSTGAFRLLRLDKIPQKTFSKIKSDGYPFFFESMVVLNVNRFNISEIPIVLAARSAGHSKLHFTDLIKSLWYMVQLRYRMIFDKWSLIS
jgi:dolichol-phosphate mannosyltransferase